MKILIAVALGGAVGAVARYQIIDLVVRWLGAGFYGVAFVNVAGSFLLGIVAELVALRFGGDPALRAFLAIGMLGGFTTFSSFALDVSVLVEGRQFLIAALYVAGSVALSILALFAGLWLARSVLA